MSTHVLNNDLLYQSFMLGAKNVINEKNHLNQINVFPVPDGDTGTNLASMMHSILNHAKKGETPKDTIQSIADAAIIGARGNSGIIFAEYIHGFSKEILNDVVDGETLAKTAEHATNSAYQAIAVPVEGTMITVMKAWSNALKNFVKASTNLVDLFSSAYQVAKEELEKTPEKLEVLKKNKVVDAGAKGFVSFIEGFEKALKGEQVDMVEQSIDMASSVHVDHLEDSQYRYCTEALIKGQNFDLDHLRKQLLPLGDSLVVAGTASVVRIHIHTNHPEVVFEHLDGIATIMEQKVDDMKKQFEAANHRKYKIALVTDSIADLPVSMIDQYQIHQIPINLHMNETNYYDKVTIQSSRFYKMMDSIEVYPTSSQPNVKALENFFSFLTTYYSEIIVLTVSEKMSGTYHAFMEATSKFTQKIKVINSKQNSGAEGLLVLKAAELIALDLPFDDVVKQLEDLTAKTKILVSVKTLKYMVRSGRVSKVTGVIGKLLNLKPVVSIDEEGQGIIFAKGLSLSSSNQKIRQHIEKVHQTYGIERYAIVHANAKDRADDYEAVYTKLLGMKPSYVMDISTVVAMSAGIGTVAIAYIRKDQS